MDYFVLRFDHSYRKEDFRALSKLAGKTTRKWSSRIISVFGFAVGLFAFLSGILMLWSDREISDLTATLLLFGGLCLVLCFSAAGSMRGVREGRRSASKTLR